MELISREQDTGEIIVHPLILQVEPFKSVYKSDRSYQKQESYRKFAYVWYAEDPESPIRQKYPRNSEELLLQAKKLTNITDKELKDKQLTELRDVYYEIFAPKEVDYFDRAIAKLEELLDFLDDIDLNERDKANNKLIHNPTSIVTTSMEIPNHIAKLKQAKELAIKSQKELISKGKVKINSFELKKPVSTRF